ncbi:MAG: CDP-alcohol phosphatidyltransferase family protein [Deltaproteobacteria bacterium]|jgi:hypothetical protein|nr:CDP-alcohol phosphatidyltransferase family protein [Deltaproteobacteria bacterium]MBW2536142.1 CDP-alcohol phosphatidyltransferase family protein [Deltaproteobacteria bacterium]
MTETSASRNERRGFKPSDVEEPIDRYFHRPLASLVVRALLPLPVTPNQVTFFSAFLGLCAGGTMLMGVWRSAWWVAAGGAVLLLSILFDCADGQLARIRGQSTPVGRILDGVMDVAAPLAVFHGFGFFLLSRDGTFALIWPVGLAAACSLVLHTSQYDGVKNLYLHCARPDFSLGGKTLLSVEDVTEFKREYEERGERFNVFLMWVWQRWIGSQVKTFEAWADMAPKNDAERELYRGIFRTYMRTWSWLGLGLHLFMLMAAALATPFWDQAVWVVWLTMLIPMNLLHLWLVWRRPRLERRFRQALAELRSS